MIVNSNLKKEIEKNMPEDLLDLALTIINMIEKGNKNNTQIEKEIMDQLDEIMEDEYN